VAEGRATISFEAENAQLKAKLAETEAALKKTGDAAKNSGGGFGAAAEGGKKLVGAFASTIGAAGAAIGALSAAKAIGDKIAETFESGARKAEKFVASLNMADSTQALANANKLAEKRAELASKLEKSNFENLWYEQRTNAAIKEEYDTLSKTEKSLRQQVATQAARNKEAKQAVENEKTAADIASRRAEADLAMAQVAGDEAAAREVHLQAIRKLEAEAAAARTLDELIATTELIAAREELYRKAREKRAADEAKQREADLKAEQEKARKEAQAQIDAARRVRDELERLRREQEGSVFGSLGGVDYYGRGGRTSTFFGGGR